MLATTVSYLSLLENKRHNVRTENQQDVQLNINQQLANIRQGELDETIRHNHATEDLGWSSLAETSRHNQMTESISMFDANTRRQSLDISRYEAETHRYAAVQNAGIGWANVAVNQGQLDVSRQRASNDYDVGLRNAEANITNARTNEKKQSEDVRYHDMWNNIQETSNSLRSQELEWDMNINQQRQDLDKMDKIWKNSISTVKVVGDIYHNLVGDVSTVLEAAGN